MNKIKTLSEKRNLLAHGIWLKDNDKQIFVRLKVRPGMVGDMADKTKRFSKEAIKEIGEEFTAFRREFMPFAIGYHGSKLEKRVKEQMALAEALNLGSTIKLGGHGEAEQAVEPEPPTKPAP